MLLVQFTLTSTPIPPRPAALCAC